MRVCTSELMKTIDVVANDASVFVRLPQELKDIAKRNNISFSERLRCSLILELIHLYSDGLLAPCDRAWVEQKILAAPLPKSEREDGFFSIERGYLKFYKAVPSACPTDFWGTPKVYPQKMVLPVPIAHEVEEVTGDD